MKSQGTRKPHVPLPRYVVALRPPVPGNVELTQILQEAFDKAAADESSEFYNDSTPIMQLLRDNLLLWSGGTLLPLSSKTPLYSP